MSVTKEDLLSQSNQWEYSLLKISFEVLSKFVRTSQRSLSKELNLVVENIQQLPKQKNLTKQEATDSLRKFIERLNEIKEKMRKASEFENTYLRSIEKRLDYSLVPQHVKEKKLDSENINSWYDLRLARVIMDYLLREGFQKTAKLLYDSEKLEDLVDTKIYVSIGRIIKNFKDHKCDAALKWCGENRIRLVKQKVGFILIGFIK